MDGPLGQLIKAHGWSFEASHQGFMCMAAWMEHNETRLREFATGRYSRPCNVPCFAGLDASDRKSSLKTWLTVELLDVEGMSENIKLGKCVCTDHLSIYHLSIYESIHL
jgi:hypothetical protein